MVKLFPPDKRECEQCGRVEIWCEKEGKWVPDVVDGVKVNGTAFCIHEWDITGNYNPFEPTSN